MRSRAALLTPIHAAAAAAPDDVIDDAAAAAGNANTRQRATQRTTAQAAAATTATGLTIHYTMFSVNETAAGGQITVCSYKDNVR